MLKLYPPPKKIRTGRRFLATGGREHVLLTRQVPDRLHRALERFVSHATRPLTLTYAKGVSALVTISLQRGRDSEAYRLVATPDGIELAGTESGLFRGLLTLAQVLAQTGSEIPCFTIEDEPDFGARGVMLDISRCKVPSIETLENMIDGFAALKYNQLQLYTEHTFAFANHERIWADASPLTASDIIRLRHYCEERYIELVPNQNSFGHFERWLRYPDYHHLAECPEGFEHPFSGQHIPFGSTLKPTRPSLAFLKSLYTELLPLYDSQYFNIGGDEPWELGHGASALRCEELGTTSVYIDFISEIQKLVEKQDRTMMFWSDIVLREPESLRKLSRRLVALNWGYEGNHPFNRECRQVADAGLSFYVCPGTSSWNTLTGRIGNATANLANAARAGLRHGATGYLVTDWGDHGHHQYLPISYPGFVLGGCHAWNHRGSSDVDIEDALGRIYFAGIKGTPAGQLLRLGRVLELAPSPIRNATIFNRLLFWNMRHEPTATADIPAPQLQHCLDELDDIHGALAAIGGSEEGELVQHELANATRLAMHGVRRLQLFRGLRDDVVTERTNLALAIGEHERLWLARNRPGGLAESAGHLRNSLEALA